MDRIAKNEYMRRWLKTPAGRAYQLASRERKRMWARSERGREYHREYGKVLRQTPEERLRACEATKLYYRRNRDTILQKQNERRMKKYHSNPEFRMIENLRTRVNLAVSGRIKLGRTFELVGCTPRQLREYLMWQFKPGMSWENYGQWHVDHIRPCASFDLTKLEQQQECFHYTNLQPIWAVENLKKGASY